MFDPILQRFLRKDPRFLGAFVVLKLHFFELEEVVPIDIDESVVDAT